MSYLKTAAFKYLAQGLLPSRGIPHGAIFAHRGLTTLNGVFRL